VPIAQLQRAIARQRLATPAQIEQQEVVAEAVELGESHRRAV